MAVICHLEVLQKRTNTQLWTANTYVLVLRGLCVLCALCFTSVAAVPIANTGRKHQSLLKEKSPYELMSISISGYRRLLRSATTLFKRDQFALSNAKTQLKMEFLKNKSVTDLDELSALFRGIEEVDEMLRFNVVQGTLNENGNYGMIYPESFHVAALPLTNSCISSE
jgi:Complex 1 protein (LYR family)